MIRSIVREWTCLYLDIAQTTVSVQSSFVYFCILKSCCINTFGANFSEDGVIAFPTDTLYGIAASISSEIGYRRIYDIKGNLAQFF